MKVLIFHAAVSAAALTSMAQAGEALRREGHNIGLRHMAGFKRESEPAERVVVALTQSQASAYRMLLPELLLTFGEDKCVPVHLPATDAELADFDWSDLAEGLDGEHAFGMTLDQLKAEAVLRGIEVRVDSSPLELAHLLDIDYSAGAQATERNSDATNSATPLNVDRIGVRTSTILPSVNGLDLERMNDDQLRAAAAEMGVKHAVNAGRKTIIDKMTAKYAETVGAPPSGPQPASDGGTATFGEGEGQRPFDDGLEGLDADALTKVAETESVDVGRATTPETIKQKIVDARKERSNQE